MEGSTQVQRVVGSFYLQYDQMVNMISNDE